MDLRSMTQMVEIARFGHMTRATVRKMEEELGAELFHRTGAFEQVLLSGV